MISLTVPAFVRKVADEYKSTQEMDFGSLSAYFSMCLFGLENLCEGARCFPWSPSVSTLSKYLTRFNTNRFMRRLRAKVMRKIKEKKIDLDDCCYAIDDTIAGKYGEKVFRIGSWGRHGGGMIRGQRIMTLALVIKSKGIAIPLAFEFCPKKEDEEYRSSLKISVELIDTIFSQGFPNLTISFDSWFDSVELMKDLSNRKITFVIESKSNRKIKTNISPYAKWNNWKSLFKNKLRRSVKLNKTTNSKRPRKTKYIAEGYVFLRKHSARLKAVAVYNKPYGANYFAIYLTNKTDMPCSEVWGLSRARWHIEELFRALKQNLAFAKLPTTNKAAAYASICIPFAIYIKIILSDGEWNHSPGVTLGSIIDGLKEEAFEKSIDKLSDCKNSAKVVTFKIRRQATRNNKKPVNPTVNQFKEHFCHAA